MILIGSLKKMATALGKAFDSVTNPDDPIAREGMQRGLENPHSMSNAGPRVRELGPEAFKKK